MSLNKFVDLLVFPIKKAKKELAIALYIALSNALDTANDDFIVALQQVSLKTASGFWLDFWGNRFNVKRHYGELDADYRRRITSIIDDGSNTVQALQSKIMPYVSSLPIINESYGGVVSNINYTVIDFAKMYSNAYIMEIVFRSTISKSDSRMFLGVTYLGVRSYLFHYGKTSISIKSIMSVVRENKMAGVKAVYNNTDHYYSKMNLSMLGWPDGRYYEVDNVNPLVVSNALDTSVATGGSNDSVVDTYKNYAADALVGKLLKVSVGGKDYFRTIVSNSADTIFISPLPSGVSVAYGCAYSIKGDVENVIFGLSTDTKPTIGIPKGKVFYAMDTKVSSIWSGTEWI